MALPATKEGGRSLLLHHGRALTSRQLPPRRGSPVGVAECCTCCGSRRKASWLWVGAVEVVKKLLRNTRQAATQNSQAVSPGSPKSRHGIANSRGEAKAAKGQGQLGNVTGMSRQVACAKQSGKGQTTRLNHSLAHTRQWSPGRACEANSCNADCSKREGATKKPANHLVPADAPTTGHAPHGTGEAGNAQRPPTRQGHRAL